MTDTKPVPDVSAVYRPFARAHAPQPAAQSKESVPPALLAAAPLPPNAVFAQLHTRPQGLLDSEVVERREQIGADRIAHQAHETLLVLLLKRLLNPLNILLLTLASLAMAMADREAAVDICNGGAQRAALIRNAARTGRAAPARDGAHHCDGAALSGHRRNSGYTAASASIERRFPSIQRGPCTRPRRMLRRH